MNLWHYPPSLLGSEAPQVWVRVYFGVEFLIQELPDEYVHGGHMLELLCFGFVAGFVAEQGPVLQIGDNWVPPSR